MTDTVVHFTDTSEVGGAERMLLAILERLDRQRWRSVLVHHRNRGATELADAAQRLGIETRAVGGASRLAGARDLPRLARAFRAERPAIVHAHLAGSLRCTAGLLAGRIVGARVIATQQLYPSRLPPRRRLRQMLVSTAVDRYVAVSESMARVLRDSVGFSGRVAVIANAVDAEAFHSSSRDAVRAELGVVGRRPMVLALARLNRQKGLAFLIAAAERVPDALFVIAGEGSERRALEAQAQCAGVSGRVRFVGHRSDVSDLLAACDLFVLPSLSEGLPVSVLEAMASGRPVVATAIPGTDEAVEDDASGLLVPPGDVDALALAIERVLNDPDLADRLASGGRSRVRRLFSVDRMVAQISGLYEEVLRRSSPRAA